MKHAIYAAAIVALAFLLLSAAGCAGETKGADSADITGQSAISGQSSQTESQKATGSAQTDTKDDARLSQTTLSFPSFDGGGPEYSVVAEDGSIFSCASERVYGNKDHDEIDGAPYDVVFTFTGRRAGETTFTVFEYSPIDGEKNEVGVYGVTVDEALNITVEKRG